LEAKPDKVKKNLILEVEIITENHIYSHFFRQKQDTFLLLLFLYLSSHPPGKSREEQCQETPPLDFKTPKLS